MAKAGREKRVRVVANHKGGVGKTTTSVNLAAVLAEMDEGRVLLVDLDPQGNASDHVGVRDDKRPGTYRLLVEGQSLADAVVQTAFGFDVLSGGDNNIVIEAMLSGSPELAELLRDAIRTSDYDIVIIDVPPMVTHVMKAALLAADGVIVPMQLEAMPVSGLAKLRATIERQKRENEKLSLMAVFDTKSDPNTLLGREVKEMLVRECGDILMETRIRKNTPLARAFFLQEPITHYDPKCNGAADYRALAREMLERGVL